MPTSLFTGLSAFPPTPADAEGLVDVDAVGLLVERLVVAGVGSIGLLGSTGGYAYLDRSERVRATAAAVEAASGRVPLVVGVGALRTAWATELAREAERLGADGLLLAPMSYTPLTDREVAGHVRAVAAATALPLCLYNNPTTTRFTFSPPLISELAGVPGVAAIKMPMPADGDCAGEIVRLRAVTPSGFEVGYSGDRDAARFLAAGASAWYSVVAGLLPEPALRLARAAMTGQVDEAERLDAMFQPMWALLREHGGLRVMHEVARQTGLPVGDPPLPLGRVGRDVRDLVARALAALVPA